MPTPGSVEHFVAAEDRRRMGWLPCKEKERAGLASPGVDTSQRTAPVLLLGLGNPLMSDDGAGQALLSRLASHASAWARQVEFLDGGTQGLALLGTFEGRKAVVFLDAVRFGDKAGAVHVLNGDEAARMGRRAVTSHEGSAPQILAALQLLGETPAEVMLIGVEPERIQTGIGLSPAVEAGLNLAANFARSAVSRILSATE